MCVCVCVCVCLNDREMRKEEREEGRKEIGREQRETDTE